MSDDEDYAPEYADEEAPPAEDDADPETDAEEAVGAPVESEEELGLEEDAAGTDSDEDSPHEDEPYDDAAAPSDTEGSEVEKKHEAPARESKQPQKVATAPIKGHPARAEKIRTDPLLRACNKPRIVRIIAPDDRRTSNVLQKSEVAHILGMRAKQIATNARFFVEVGVLHDPGAIAFKELIERRCPLVVRRTVGADPADGALLVEEWFPNEMAHPQIVPPVQLGGAR
jgi:DNA-directed RNA polymerase subunit K/omega